MCKKMAETEKNTYLSGIAAFMKKYAKEDEKCPNKNNPKIMDCTCDDFEAALRKIIRKEMGR